MTLDLEETKDQGSFFWRAVPADNSFWKAGGQITPLGPLDWSLVSARCMEFGNYKVFPLRKGAFFYWDFTDLAT